MLSSGHIAAAERDLAKRIFRLFEPPPLMTVDEWANKYRQLSKVSNAKGGRWRSRCYQQEIMREMTNKDVRSIVLVGAAQTCGKSELLLNFIGRNIHLNPGPMMLVLPTNDLAERLSKKRIGPMFAETRVLFEIVGDQKSRKSNNTIRAKEFPGGALNIAGANTPNELCSDPQRDVIVDEVDRCEKSAGKEGDVIALVEARQETFGDDAFSFYTSSPSGKKPRPVGDKQPVGVSKILLMYEESDKREWHCPCQNCGHFQVLRWRNVRWQNDDPDSARVHCESCNHPHDDAGRIRMIEQGKWVCQAPFKGRRGYFINGIYSLSAPQRGSNSRLAQMVRDFLRAKRRGAEALRAWTNTFLCECFIEEDDADRPDGTALLAKRQPYGERLPEGVLMLTAGLDVQRGDKGGNGRVEMFVHGWGANDEMWAVDHQVVTGDPEHPSLWQQVDAILHEPYLGANGNELIIERAAIDTGHAAEAVYDFAQSRSARVVRGQTQRIIAIKGFKGVGRPVMNLPQKSGVKRVRLWLVATNTAKLWVYGTIQKVLAGEQSVAHWPSDRSPLFGEDYFAQLTAEPVQRRFAAGLEFTEFLKPEGRNEALDGLVYALAALRFAPVNWEKQRLRTIQSTSAPAEKAQEYPNRYEPRSQNWGGISNWRV